MANKFIMTASNVSVSEMKSNRKYFSVSMRMFSTRNNLNGCAVTEAFIDDIIDHKDEYVCMPLCADVSKLKRKDYRGLTHLYNPSDGLFYTTEVGSFYDYEKVEDDYGISLIGYARINKRSAVVCEAIQELYDRGDLNFSFEISAGAVQKIDGIQIIDVDVENELVAMAIVSVPAYPESKALALVAEAKTENVDSFYAKASVLVSEMTFEVIREAFYRVLYDVFGDKMYSKMVILFGPERVVLHDTISGKLTCVEYVVEDSDILIKDVYDSEIVRVKEGEELMDNDVRVVGLAENLDESNEKKEEEKVVEETQKETTTEVVVDDEQKKEDPAPADRPECVVEYDCDDEHDHDDHDDYKLREAECKKRISELEAEVEMQNQVEAAYEAMKQKIVDEANASKKESLTAYAEQHGLNTSDTVIAEAIANLDYEHVFNAIAESENKSKKAEFAFAGFADIKPNGELNYLFRRD